MKTETFDGEMRNHVVLTIIIHIQTVILMIELYYFSIY
jgi:hypothetical protein